MKKLILVLGIVAATMSCGKNSSCYDADLQKEYELILCTEDCPGIKGCDGKTYCNECIAASNGIRPK